MLRWYIKSLTTSIFLLLFTAGFLNAQFIIEEAVYEIPVGFDLMPEDDDFRTSDEEAEYFLNLPEDKLKSSDMAAGEELEIERSTYFFDGENIAIETRTPDFGKTTTVIKSGENKFYFITWSKKMVMEVTPEALKAMQQLSPEVHEGMKPGENSDILEDSKFQETGKTAKIRGFDCKQYIKKDQDKMTIIWASEDKNGMTGIMTDAMDKMQRLDPDAGENSQDTWTLLQGMIPIEVRSMQTDSDSDVPEIKIRSIMEIKKTTPGADKFTIPGTSEGFRQTSMEDYLE